MPAAGPQNTRAKQVAKKKRAPSGGGPNGNGTVAPTRSRAAPTYTPHQSAPKKHAVVRAKAKPLAHEQRHVLRMVKTIGKKRGATPKEIKAAVETGLVESNLRNLHYGDSDSQGWRQERKSIYRNPTNLRASIHRFYDETEKIRDKYARAGDLAAAVQRPAAQYKSRYQKRSGDAKRLLNKGRYV